MSVKKGVRRRCHQPGGRKKRDRPLKDPAEQIEGLDSYKNRDPNVSSPDWRETEKLDGTSKSQDFSENLASGVRQGSGFVRECEIRLGEYSSVSS